MKSYNYYAVVWNGDIYCNECLAISLDTDEVHPIFVDSEWDIFPVCCVCREEHTYVNIIKNEEII